MFQIVNYVLEMDFLFRFGTCLMNVGILKFVFPVFFSSISLLQDVSISRMSGWFNGERSWGDFGIPLRSFSEAATTVVDLRRLLQFVSSDADFSDKASWRPSVDGLFSVSSCYDLIRCRFFPLA